MSKNRMMLSSRPRRNRRTPFLRNAVAETHLGTENLVYPIFLQDKIQGKIEISTMPGQFRHSIDTLSQLIEDSLKLGIQSFALFPAVDKAKKSSSGKEALNPKGLIPTALKKLTKRFPEALFISDLALDPFTTHGHDGIVENGKVVNDKTVEILAKMAVLHAESGASYVAPSDMMDGRVGKIREQLDHNSWIDTGIISYAAKYASAFYGPFREALDSAPKAGDKKTYQMDYRNSKEALREVLLDVSEGADIVMVKPALSYLDVIRRVKDVVHIPVAAYNVSGEYAMIKMAAQQGAFSESDIILETMYSMRRAGADILFTYFAQDVAKLLNHRS